MLVPIINIVGMWIFAFGKRRNDEALLATSSERAKVEVRNVAEMIEALRSEQEPPHCAEWALAQDVVKAAEALQRLGHRPGSNNNSTMLPLRQKAQSPHGGTIERSCHQYDQRERHEIERLLPWHAGRDARSSLNRACRVGGRLAGRNRGAAQCRDAPRPRLPPS